MPEGKIAKMGSCVNEIGALDVAGNVVGGDTSGSWTLSQCTQSLPPPKKRVVGDEPSGDRVSLMQALK